MMTEPKIIKLPQKVDPRGNLSFFENNAQIPFEIKRTYWIYDVPGGAARGGHAYKNTAEFVVALSGSFDVILDDGTGKEPQVFSLNRSYYGLYIPKMYWRTMNNFSTNSLALIVASTPYDEKDYIRDFNQFAEMKKGAVDEK
ncbi:MAG: FdtA/QdtA family cupin domain-containing protein [Treponemataceae bacterium]|nr:FdtA/QdtA family cupin domain-containing protein [Treponemataceae bacterium]